MSSPDSSCEAHVVEHTFLHPQIAELLDAMNASGVPPIASCTPAEVRARRASRRALLSDGPDVAEMRAVRIPRVGDDGEIPARLYVPHDSSAGVVVYLHGGGWVTGEPDDYDALCRMLAVESGVSVLSVDYRLAPEHPYPAGLEDSFQALAWAAESLAAGGPLIVVGDSSGGNLAAVCAQQATERAAFELALQVLIYPVTDHDFDTASYNEYASGFSLGVEEMKWYWDQYVPDPAARRDPNASPLRAPAFSGLPPTLLIVAEHDPLRDEALAYGERLAADGVPVSVVRFGDAIHGFFALATYLERGDEAVRLIGEAVRRVTQNVVASP
jgi:acetyl esterase